MREIKKQERERERERESKRHGKAAGENEGGGVRTVAISTKDYAGALEGSDR